MKLSFWTLGMPAWTNAEFARRASELGYDGIDLRCTKPENGQPSDLGNLSIETSPEDLDELKRAYAQAGVEISCLLCYNRGGHHGDGKTDWDALEADVVAHARVASRVGSPRIRVTVGRPEAGVGWDEYLDNLGKTCLSAVKETPNVSAVFENHVGSASARQLLEMVERLGDSHLGVVFSPDHCLVMQENAIELADSHWSAIQQVCFADRKVVEEDLGKFDGRYYYVRYESCWNGDGNIPAASIFNTLARRGYDGYVALKWEKSARFGHHLPNGEEALEHFPGFIRSFGVTGAER